MSTVTQVDPTEIRLAAEELLEALATLADERHEPRREGVDDRSRGLAYLLELAEGGDGFAGLLDRTPPHQRAVLEGLFAFAVQAVGGDWAAICLGCGIPSERHYCPDCGAGREAFENPAWINPNAISDPSNRVEGPCQVCGAISQRRYCASCAHELSVTERENPPYGSQVNAA